MECFSGRSYDGDHCAEYRIQLTGAASWFSRLQFCRNQGKLPSLFVIDNCIHSDTVQIIMFIQFPFIEVPKELRKIVGEPTPGTRAYRREGTHEECGQWLEALGEHYKGDVGLSPSA